MSATPSRLVSFYRTSVGKKAVMAVTGAIMVGWLVLHVLGNLQIFAGAETINGYSAFLHRTPELLWPVRIVLIVSVLLHIQAAVALYSARARTRPIPYAKKQNRGATIMSRTMQWTGLFLLLFIIFHLLHMTTGTLHRDFVEGDVYHNLVSAFSQPAMAALYILAMAFLAMHLYHGLYSFTQSLGASNRRWSLRIKSIAAVVAIVIAVAFAAVPLAILTHVIG